MTDDLLDLNRKVQWLLLGDDLTANTDERLLRRFYHGFDAYGFSWNGKRYSGSSVRDTGPPIWHNRHGKPYQADLEAHVLAWRAQPKNWASWAMMGEMCDLAAAKGLHTSYERMPDGWDVLVERAQLALGQFQVINERLCREEVPAAVARGIVQVLESKGE